jgi:hypothetical protein
VRNRRSRLSLDVVDDEARRRQTARRSKEASEGVFFVPVLDRMLFPDERIRGDREEAVEILRAQGPQSQEIASQDGLEVDGA